MSDLALVLACAAKMLLNFSPVLALWLVITSAIKSTETVDRVSENVYSGFRQTKGPGGNRGPERNH